MVARSSIFLELSQAEGRALERLASEAAYDRESLRAVLRAEPTIRAGLRALDKLRAALSAAPPHSPKEPTS